MHLLKMVDKVGTHILAVSLITLTGISLDLPSSSSDMTVSISCSEYSLRLMFAVHASFFKNIRNF